MRLRSSTSLYMSEGASLDLLLFCARARFSSHFFSSISLLAFVRYIGLFVMSLC